MADIFSIVGAGAGIIESIFGGKPAKTSEQAIAERLPEWRKRLNDFQYKFLVDWIQNRFEKGDWKTQCPNGVFTGGILAGGYQPHRMCEKKINDILGDYPIDPRKHCTDDWRVFHEQFKKLEAQATGQVQEAGIIPGMPSIGGISPLLIAAIALGLYLLFKKR